MKTKIIITATILLTALWSLAAPPVEEGKTIFAARCAACHNVSKDLVGPALAGIDERRSMDWIVSFVHSPQTVIKGGDAYAVALLDKFKVQMPDHKDLTEDNIKNIVAFIKSEAGAASQNAVAKSEPVTKETSYSKLVLSNQGLLLSSIILVAILIAALWFLGKTKQMRSKTS